MSSIPNMPRRASLQDVVQDSVKNHIIRNQLRPGDLLPPEAQLARQLGVSRASLREAIRALQILGVVESRHGSGTYVGRFRLDPVLAGMAFSIRTSDDVSALQALREVLEVRSVLECHMIRKVALEISETQLDELAHQVELMAARAAEGKMFAAQDVAFHELMYASLDNSLFVQLVRTFWQLFEQVEENLRSIDDELHLVVDSHRAILKALRQHDSDAAEYAMIQHLKGIEQRVSSTTRW